MAKKKKPAKLDWKDCSYANADELASKIDWEGGLAEFLNYNGGGEGLPEPLKSAADAADRALRECEQVFTEHECLL